MLKENKKYPTFEEELKIWSKGYKYVAGMDEVGCGCWAGPVVSAAVILAPEFNDPGVMDSKMLTGLKRERYYDIIIKEALDYAIGEASENEIDHFGLGRAKVMAMQRALSKLNLRPDYVLIDGNNLSLRGYPYQTIVRGDQKAKSIACASIIAKVFRDHKIIKLAEKYPGYGFKSNKGYGTKEHIDGLERRGICAIHRQSYQPIKKILNKNK